MLHTVVNRLNREAIESKNCRTNWVVGNDEVYNGNKDAVIEREEMTD